MKRILVIADPHGQTQHTIRRAVRLGAQLDARLDIVGFVYEHITNLPTTLNKGQLGKLRDQLVAKHRVALRHALDKAVGDKKIKASVDVRWEKRIADRITSRLKEQQYDLVMKGAHRSETVVYTPTDWQLLRGSNAPVLLFAEKRWKNSTHVMAAVDLGTKIRSKMKLNYDIVEHAHRMAMALGSKLHVAYAIPLSVIMRDLEILDVSKLRDQGKQRAKQFRASLSERGIEIEGMHVAVGVPEKVLVSIAARHHARLVVLGCIGRKRLAGRVIGNTAEKILRLLKADILAIKP